MRIITRPDFDGIVCAVLLSDALSIPGPIIWAEPHSMQHGQVGVFPGDIIANLGYHENCGLWFDHHESNRIDNSFKGRFRIAPSAAGIIYEYYKDDPENPFKRDYTRLIEETDKIDSANLSIDEVLHPGKFPFMALSMTILSHNFEDEPYWNLLVDLLQHHDIEEILDHPEVKERVEKALDSNEKFIHLLNTHTKDEGEITITDFRSFEKIPVGNRFLVFYLYPDSLVNVRLRYDKSDKARTRISVGHSIFNRGSAVHCGLLCAQYGGGGHRGAGACTIPSGQTVSTLQNILKLLQSNQILPFPVLFEDNFLIAIDKPSGLLCADSFINAVEQYLYQNSDFTGTLQIVFPVSREISGIVLMAKNKKSGEILRQGSPNMIRTYTVIISGHPADPRGTFLSWDFLNTDENNIPIQNGNSDSLPFLKYWLLNRIGSFSLLKIEPTLSMDEFAIRKTLLNMGLPIAGDISNSSAENPVSQYGLHLSFMAFNHPITRKRIAIDSPIPPAFFLPNQNNKGK